MSTVPEPIRIYLIDYIAFGCPNCPGESGESLLSQDKNGVTTCDCCGHPFIVLSDQGEKLVPRVGS